MRVFIGFDPRQTVAFQVCAQSVWEHASKPVEIVRLDLRSLPITRRGLTEFSYSRFLVPYLSEFKGRSLFLDSDILVRGDVWELDSLTFARDSNVAMVIGPHRFEWASVMLFNNWNCQEMTPQYVESEKCFDYKWAKSPVNLRGEWNHLISYDEPNPNAKIVHFTKGIPVWKETAGCEFAGEWVDTFKRMNSTVSHEELMGKSVHVVAPPVLVPVLDIQGVLTAAERQDQMQQAINRGLPFIRNRRSAQFNSGVMSIVGYGPSLRDTWHKITHPIIATSGAYDFLVKKKIVPEYYVAIDPSQNTAELLKDPQPSTQFIMASVLHPDFWAILEGYDVKLWHLDDGPETVDWVRRHHPAGMDCLIGGGSSVGQRAMNVAAWMGYRRFRIFGMDGSFHVERHAGEHNCEIQRVIEVVMGDKVFKTTPSLLQSAQEIQEFLLTVDAETEFYGDGLIQEVARMVKKGERNGRRIRSGRMGE